MEWHNDGSVTDLPVVKVYAGQTQQDTLLNTKDLNVDQINLLIRCVDTYIEQNEYTEAITK